MANEWTDLPACEEWGGQSENVGEDGIQCQVILRVPYETRWDYVRDIVGLRRPWPWETGTGPIRPRARSCAMKPWDSQATTSGQALVYSDALLTVNYSTMHYDAVNLVAEALEPDVQFQIQPFSLFRWGSATGDPISENEAPGRQKYSLALTRTLFKVPPPLPGILLTAPGHVNAVPYTSALLGLTFAAETLLYMPAPMNRTLTTSYDSDAWDVNVKFAFNPDGWNRYWRAATQTYESMYVAETAALYNNFPTADFSDLLF